MLCVERIQIWTSICGAVSAHTGSMLRHSHPFFFTYNPLLSCDLSTRLSILWPRWEFGKVVPWSEVSFCSRFLFWMSQRKLAETRKYYATYNALAEAHELTMKETSLLNSIHSQACTLFSLFLLSYLEFATVLCRGLVTGSSQMDFMWFVARYVGFVHRRPVDQKGTWCLVKIRMSLWFFI